MSKETHAEPHGKASRLSHFVLWRALFSKDEDLDARDAASTLFRLFRSKHVRDLKVVLYAACLLLSLCVVSVVSWAFFGGIAALFDPKGPPAAVALVGSIVPISGAIVAWTYLTASKRLGVVDLFACEIATLCRVGTIFNVGEQRVQTWKRINERNAMESQTRSPPTPAPGNYVSQEDYFPIFDANSQDLETLEALVVGHITEFYTYMKSVRDCQRKLGQAQTVEDGKEAAANIVYMLFLGYESARKAVSDLVEFQPTRTENIVVILLTELFCYSFLCEHFKHDDLKFKRLQLRETDYREVILELEKRVALPHSGNEKYWAPAKETIFELHKRYHDALNTLERCQQSRNAEHRPNDPEAQYSNAPRAA
jgi:hypothetical protein